MERALTNVDCCYLDCRRALAAGYIISYQLFNMATLLCSSFKEHTHTVILFHELGSNGNTFCSASTYVEAGDIYTTIKWIFANAKHGELAQFEESISHGSTCETSRSPGPAKICKFLVRAEALIVSVRLSKTSYSTSQEMYLSWWLQPRVCHRDPSLIDWRHET